MLKKQITYKNFDGNTVTEDFYFNLTKAELVELELSEKDGISETLKAIVDSRDGAKIIEYFKRIVLLSYGEKSEDGKRFMKSPEMAASFSHTEAYSVLFMELATNAEKAAIFVNGIMPSDLVEEIATLPPAVAEAHNPDISSVETKDLSTMTREELEEVIRAQKL